MTGVGAYTWGSTAQLVADVQGWLNNPATNFGWALRGNEGLAQSAKSFATKESPTAGLRPVLTIDFTSATPPPPSGQFPLPIGNRKVPALKSSPRTQRVRRRWLPAAP